MLINYILKEADYFRQQMLDDLAELRKERDNLEGKVGQVGQKNHTLQAQARSIQQKHDDANAKLQMLQNQYEQEKELK